MANIKIEIPVRLFDSKEAECMCNFFSGIKISWLFCQKESQFVSNATIKELLGNNYRHQTIKIQKLLTMFPENKELKETLVRCKEKEKNDKIYDVTVVFEGEIAAEIDIANNSIMHYVGPMITNLTNRDISRAKKLVKNDFLDEFYDDYIKKFIICIIMASIFAAPNISLGFTVHTLIDGNKYATGSFIENPLHTEAFHQYASLMMTDLNYVQAFSWLKQYTKLQEYCPEPPVPFTILTYLFNRDSHESLLYSVIGLENLYSAKSKNIAEKLYQRIAYIFPTITQEQIKSMYASRSDFVHGKISIPIYKDYGYFDFDDVSILACALLLETMRKLAANNATQILFDVYRSYRFV